jgi:hypothetical protein
MGLREAGNIADTRIGMHTLEEMRVCRRVGTAYRMGEKAVGLVNYSRNDTLEYSKASRNSKHLGHSKYFGNPVAMGYLKQSGHFILFKILERSLDSDEIGSANNSNKE